MIVSIPEFKELESEMHYPNKLPPLYENVFLWTGSQWLVTYLWSPDRDDLRWNCMGHWSDWPLWVKIKQPAIPGSEIKEPT